MIGPVPQKPVTPPDARGDPGDQLGGRAPNDLFAQLLGPTVGSPVAAAHSLAVPEAVTVPEAPVLTPKLAEQRLPGPDVAVHQPAPLARVFNQDGFFGHAGQAPDQALTLPGDGAGAPPAPSEPSAEVSAVRAEAPATAGKATRSVAPNTPVMRVLKSDSAPAAAKFAGIVEGRAPAAAGEAEESEPLAPLQRRAFRASPAARSPVHIALSELENGLQVSARVEGLDEAERRQLRDEIAALLGRHGLPAARIRINAVPPRENER